MPPTILVLDTLGQVIFFIYSDLYIICGNPFEEFSILPGFQFEIFYLFSGKSELCFTGHFPAFVEDKFLITESCPIH